MGIDRSQRRGYSNATPILVFAGLLCGTSLITAADPPGDHPGFAIVRSQSPDSAKDARRTSEAAPFIDSSDYLGNPRVEQSFPTGPASLHSSPATIPSYRPAICPAPPCSDARRKLYDMVQKFKGDSAYPHCPPYRAPGTYGYNVSCWRRLPEIAPCCLREDRIEEPQPTDPPAAPTPLAIRKSKLHSDPFEN